jgi:hypothetical protein
MYVALVTHNRMFDEKKTIVLNLQLRQLADGLKNNQYNGGSK